jgi:hypothetical protein
MAKNITCPACNYTRRPEDTGTVPDWECPMCQKAYAKTSRTPTSEELRESSPLNAGVDALQAASQSVTDTVTEPPEDYISFDASRFNDPIAMRTGFTHNFDSLDTSYRKLVEVSGNRAEFRASGMAKLLGFFFCLAGILLAIHLYNDRSVHGWALVVPSLFALLFVYGGYMLFRRAEVPALFDKTTGYFSKQRMTTTGIESDSKGYIAKLTDIHAIQLISFFVNDNVGKLDLWYLELNLVLNDCSRMNVVRYTPYTRDLNYPDSFCNSTADALRDDAQALSSFLGKPVWDAIDDTKTLTRNKPISIFRPNPAY